MSILSLHLTALSFQTMIPEKFLIPPSGLLVRRCAGGLRLFLVVFVPCVAAWLARGSPGGPCCRAVSRPGRPACRSVPRPAGSAARLANLFSAAVWRAGRLAGRLAGWSASWPAGRLACLWPAGCRVLCRPGRGCEKCGKNVEKI